MIFEDVIARLKQLDEITLMEVLEISSEDLVERFQDKVELKLEYLIKKRKVLLILNGTGLLEVLLLLKFYLKLLPESLLILRLVVTEKLLEYTKK